MKVEDNTELPSSSEFHDRLFGDSESDLIPLRVVQPSEEVVQDEVEDLFGIQIVSYGYKFEVNN